MPMLNKRKLAMVASRPDHISRSRFWPDASAHPAANDRKPVLTLINGGNADGLNAAAVAAPAGDHSPFVLFIR